MLRLHCLNTNHRDRVESFCYTRDQHTTLLESQVERECRRVRRTPLTQFHYYIYFKNLIDIDYGEQDRQYLQDMVGMSSSLFNHSNLLDMTPNCDPRGRDIAFLVDMHITDHWLQLGIQVDRSSELVSRRPNC